MTNKVLKRFLYTSLALVAISVLSTYFIGSYFIDFALVPNKGGENRSDASKEAQKNKEGYEEPQEELKIKIELAKKMERELCNKWLEEIKSNTHPTSIIAQDGAKLVGNKFVHPYNVDKWVVVVHGYQSDEVASKKIARHYYNRGFNALTINLRCHGESEGKYIGMGVLDKDDLFLWTTSILKENKNAKIVYHGTSMGSATVLFASGLKLPSNVRAIVADCGYSNVWDVFASELSNRFGLPTFPILYMADIMGRIKAGYSIKNASVLDAVRVSDVPTLFIHTTSDDFVPIGMVHELYKAKNGIKDLYIVRGANHTEAKYVNMDAYYTKIFSFLEDKLI